MSHSTLVLAEIDFRSLPLTPEEGFVLSRIPGSVRASELPALTGLESARVAEVVRRLVELGALVLADGAQPPVSKRGSPPVDRAAGRKPAPGSAMSTTGQSRRDEAAQGPSRQRVDELRARYARRFGDLKPADRANRAQHAEGEDLLCLCLDAHPQVVLALLANSRLGAEHTRLLAEYHSNASGLELLARSDFARADPVVAERLLHNQLAPVGVMRRALKELPLPIAYAVCSKSDVSAAVREQFKQTLPARFMRARAEERAELILRSEGQILDDVPGFAFDGQLTAILRAQTYDSYPLVERLARFAETPPSLLEALLRQPFVRERPDLEALLMNHHNMQGRVFQAL